ncbi:MAG: DUF2069 domain-containing protein [Pseudomonadota bacterium]|nr:DUF2069 domain-containing protein [Pseudomonadota bacterium]
MKASDRFLAAALLALATLYAFWSRDNVGQLAVLLVFVGPPLLLAIALWRRVATAAFWAGVLALGWFSHAVMTAWASPGEAVPALLAMLLSVAIVFASSWTGLKARREKKRLR